MGDVPSSHLCYVKSYWEANNRGDVDRCWHSHSRCSLKRREQFAARVCSDTCWVTDGKWDSVLGIITRWYAMPKYSEDSRQQAVFGGEWCRLDLWKGSCREMYSDCGASEGTTSFSVQRAISKVSRIPRDKMDGRCPPVALPLAAMPQIVHVYVLQCESCKRRGPSDQQISCLNCFHCRNS